MMPSALHPNLQRARKTNLEKSGRLDKPAGAYKSLVNKFEERAAIAKNAMNEDLAIAELMKEKDRFSICGLVHDLIRWDRPYQAACACGRL